MENQKKDKSWIGFFFVVFLIVVFIVFCLVYSIVKTLKDSASENLDNNFTYSCVRNLYLELACMDSLNDSCEDMGLNIIQQAEEARFV